jgi:hypothetical protein
MNDNEIPEAIKNKNSQNGAKCDSFPGHVRKVLFF